MRIEYDPIDLVFLACGWAQGAAESGRAHALTIGWAVDLEDAARILARLYVEVRDEWDGLWAYDVAEPLGIWIGRTFGKSGDIPRFDEIEAAARSIVAEALKAVRTFRKTQQRVTNHEAL